MTKHPISAVLITYNCGDLFTKTLESVQWCDEVIVVDSGSTDKTLEICQQFNCKVYHHTFEGYGKQKQFAVHLAKNDWILSIDGDEVISTELKDEIIERFSKETVPEHAFRLPITMVFLGRVFKYGRENKKLNLRLFNRKFGNFNNADLHESIKIEGNIFDFKNEVLHYSYINLHQYFEKFNKYSSIFVIQAFDKGKRANIFIMFVRRPFDFLKHYLIDLNFLNGYEGFVWSVFCSYYSFVKYVKLGEYQRNKK